MPTSSTFAPAFCAACVIAVRLSAVKFERQAPQRVVAAELDDHHGRLVLGQQRRQPRTAARCGVAADAGIDHASGDLFLGKLLVQQRHPAGAARQAVFRAQRVAQTSTTLPSLDLAAGEVDATAAAALVP
jgi:hypothetical protein